MRTWRNAGLTCLPLAVALVASTVGCEARSNALAVSTSNQCSTCHGHPPAKDAHVVHFQADTAGIPHAQLECRECHRDVQSIDQPDHVFAADDTPLPGPAVVRFDDAKALASITAQGATRAGAPTYDKTTRACSNVYCHGTGLRASTAGATPAWDAPTGAVGCGSCHSIPPADHPAGTKLSDCTTCHGDAIDAAGKPSAAKHVNGKIDLGANVTTSCATCHGDGSANVPPGDPRSAPPRDADGNSTSPAVGAHQNHLVAGTLGVKVACSECHPVPSTLFASGHFDKQVEVKFGPLASKGGLAPTYDPATQTCSSVYCHGNFPKSRTTLPPPAPTWNGGADAVACGSCHDLPPPEPTHVTVDVVAQGCSTSTNPATTCHPAPSAGKPGYSFDPATRTGTVDPALHIDGKICPPACGN